jgi:hypothetical protein
MRLSFAEAKPDETDDAKGPRRPSLLSLPPTMPLDKPILKELDKDNLELSWEPATLPFNAKPVGIK